MIAIMPIVLGVMVYMGVNLIESGRQHKIDDCIIKAQQDYSKAWDKKCGVNGKGKDCTLPEMDGTVLDVNLAADRAICVGRYK